MARTTPEIPSAPRRRLQRLYDRYRTSPARGKAELRFYATLGEFHNKHWSYESVAQALGVSRETVRIWSKRGTGNAAPAFDVPDRIQPAPAKAPPPSVPDDVAKRMQELMPLARLTNGSSHVGAQTREASAEYSRLIAEQRARGVPTHDIAKAAGQSWNTLRARLARHQYLSPTKTAPAYKGTPKGYKDAERA